MMNSEEKVIDIFSSKQHLTGKAFCMACHHEWIAVCSVGMTTLECPNCSAEKGRMKYECVRSGDNWRCHCGNMYFSIMPDCIYCPNCGESQRPYD